MAATVATSVGTGAAAQIDTGLPSAPGATVVVSNLGPTNPIFVGGPGVTSGTGIQVAAGANLVLPHRPDPGGLYAIATTAGVTVVVGTF